MKINGILISSTSDEHGSIYVYNTRTARILSFDGKIYQGYMKLKAINRLDLAYTQAMMAGLFFTPSVKIATIMGLGAGSIAKNLLCTYPALDIHAVEYRQAVVDIAKEHFFLPDSDRLFIYRDDAVNYIKNTCVKSDIIFSDLYSSKGMEPKQVQSSYLRDCKNKLTQHGVLVLNIVTSVFKSPQELDELLEPEFANRYLSFEVGRGNTIVFAFKNNIPSITRENLLNKGKELEVLMDIPMAEYALLLWDVVDDNKC